MIKVDLLLEQLLGLVEGLNRGVSGGKRLLGGKSEKTYNRSGGYRRHDKQSLHGRTPRKKVTVLVRIHFEMRAILCAPWGWAPARRLPECTEEKSVAQLKELRDIYTRPLRSIARR